MKFLLLDLMLLAFATTVLTKRCTPVNGRCSHIKDTWPDNCCDPPAGSGLEKFCETRDKRDWMNNVGICVHRSNPKGRNDYKYLGSKQCSPDNCNWDSDCCMGNYCDTKFGCLPRSGRGDPITEEGLKRQNEQAERRQEQYKLTLNLHKKSLRYKGDKRNKTMVIHERNIAEQNLKNFVPYIPVPCVQNSKCVRKEGADSFHYIQENRRCEKIMKGSNRPCNIGYRRLHICTERCLNMVNSNYNNIQLDPSLQHDYDDMVKWSNAPPAAPLPPLPAKTCSEIGEDCEPGKKLGCCDPEAVVCRVDYSRGEVQTYKWQCRDGRAGYK